MLKNKFKIIALLMVIILAISMPIVRAENEADIDATASETNDVELISEEPSDSTAQNTTNAADESFKKSDIYLIGDEVVIDYIIDGNLFVIADTVTINSQIGGDAFICANSITVREQGYIFSNLFAVSENIDIKGVVYDVYAISNDITISGYIYRDIKSGCKNLNILGTVGRNAFVDCSNISFTSSENTDSAVASHGMINGNIEYTATQELTFPEGTVAGEVKFTQMSESNKNDLASYLMALGTFVVTTLIIGLLGLWLAPKFIEKSANLLSNKILPVIGLGIIAPIAFVIISIVLLMFGITVNVAIIALMLFILLALISSSIFVIAVANLVCNKINIEKKAVKFGVLVISAIVVWLLTLIPVAGFIINMIISILGFGIVTSNFFIKDASKTKIEK